MTKKIKNKNHTEENDVMENNKIYFCIIGSSIHLFRDLDDAFHKRDLYAGDANQFIIEAWKGLYKTCSDCIDNFNVPGENVELKCIYNLPFNQLIEYDNLFKVRNKIYASFLNNKFNKTSYDIGRGFLDLIQDIGYQINVNIFPTTYNNELTYLFEVSDYIELLVYIIFECSLRNILNISICPNCMQAFKPNTRKSEIFCSTQCRKQWNNKKRDSNPARKKYESRRKLIRNEVGLDPKKYNLYIKWTEITKEKYDEIYNKYKYKEDDFSPLNLAMYSMMYSNDNLHSKDLQYKKYSKETEKEAKEIDDFAKYLKEVWEDLKRTKNGKI